MHAVLLLLCLELPLASCVDFSTHRHTRLTGPSEKQKKTLPSASAREGQWSFVDFESRLISTAPLVEQNDQCVAHHGTYP
jgi:hypothetical protein